MKLTGRFRVAVLSILDVALRQNAGPVSAASIHARQKVSFSYLEGLMIGMRRGGIIESVRGKGGGYVLSRPAKDISIYEIMESVDEVDGLRRHRSDFGADPSHAKYAADPSSGKITHDLWHAFEAHVIGMLKEISLQELFDAEMDKGFEAPVKRPNLKSEAIKPLLKERMPNGPNSVFSLGAYT